MNQFDTTGLQLDMTKFERFESSHTGRRAKSLLRNSHSSYTLKALYIVMHNAAVASTSSLISEFPYFTKQLSNAEFWSGLSLPEKGVSGFCMASLVRVKGVPFVSGGKGGGSRKYKLSPEHVRGLIEAYHRKQMIAGE